MKQYRVIIWGPGGVGRACLRELVKRKELKLVGVLAYSESKSGIDAGDLIGHAPLDVFVTTDKEKIFALDADCVLWTGMPPFDPASMDRDVKRLLESGKSVITSAAYHYPPRHGKAYVEEFEQACRKGHSCLHGTGENPGFWFERVIPTLTGICSEVEHIKLNEFLDCGSGGTTGETLYACGFNMTEEEAEKPGLLSALWENFYYVETLDFVANALWGRGTDRIVSSLQHIPAEKDIDLRVADGDIIDIHIDKGKTGAIVHSFTGFIGDTPRLSTKVNWFLRPENSPFPIKSSNYWQVEIEAKPVSLRCEFSAFASLKGDQEFHPGDPTSSSWYATAVPMIQAIPVLANHEPGIVYPTAFANSVDDLRTLATRRSLVT